MKEILKQILKLLTDAECESDIVYRDLNDEIGKLFVDDITLIEVGSTKQMFIGGLGEMKSYERVFKLVYRNTLSKQIIVKPKEIMDFLTNNESTFNQLQNEK